MFKSRGAPEVNYFSIRRLGLPNLPHDTARRITESPTSTINPHGLHTEFDLEKVPAECTLLVASATQAEKHITLRVDDFYDNQNGTATSYRQIVDYVKVSMNEREIAALSLNPHGFSTSYDFVELFVDGVVIFVRKCSYYEHANDPQLKAGCTVEEFR